MKVRVSCEREEVDSGCIYAENCFSCPFPDCVCQRCELDIGGEELQRRRKAVREKAMAIKNMRDSGMTINQIVASTRHSVKFVKKYLIIAEQEEKNAESDGH